MKSSIVWANPALHLGFHLLGLSVQAASLVDSRLHRAQEKLIAVSAPLTAWEKLTQVSSTETALHPVNFVLEKEAQNATYALLRFLTERLDVPNNRPAADKQIGFDHGIALSPAEVATNKQGFVADCTSSVQRTVNMVVRAYTEDQLHQALRQECALDAQFESIDAGFRSKEACDRFAAKLVAARAQEQETGSLRGYSAFCQDYWEHKTGERMGRIEQVSTTLSLEKEEESMPAWQWLLLVLLIVLGFCLCGYFLFFRMDKKPKKAVPTGDTTGDLPQGENWEAEY